MALPDHLTPDEWLQQLFSSRPATIGGVVRRQVGDVERLVGWPRMRAELDRRGFKAVVNGGQLVVFCNRDPVRWVSPQPAWKPMLRRLPRRP